MKKRKIKLFTSIVSLILVIAVMGVGVMAATSVTVNINSSASFTASANVEATIVVTETTNGITETTGIDNQYISGNTVPSETYTGFTEYSSAINLNNSEIPMDEVEGTCSYFYTIVITNKADPLSEFGTLQISIASENIPTATTNSTVTVSYQVNTGAVQNNVTSISEELLSVNDYITITISWSVVNVALSVAETTLSTVVSLSAVAGL